MALLNEARVQARYDLAFRQAAPGEVAAKAACWRSDWRMYWNYVVRHISTAPRGRTVLDFGCRYGLLSPLLLELGVAQVIGVDVLPDLEAALPLYAGQPVRLIRPESGYLPLQPGTIDVAVLNEVISHIAVADLPVVYDELQRVMAPGGVMLVSDGNGLHSTEYVQKTLQPLYEVLENGPDGFSTAVPRCFRNQRADLIRGWYPDLPDAAVERLAANTAGLHTDFLRRTVDRFARSGELVLRPYIKGSVVVEPCTGIVEERGFYPEQVVLDLQAHGFNARADVAASRTAAAWANEGTRFSFPAGNFFVHATKS